MRKIRCASCAIRGHSIACDLPVEALEDFGALSTTAIYKPRQIIFSEGGPSNGLYIVCAGAVKMYYSDRFGRDHILEIAGPGALLGELSIDEHESHSVSAEAVSESQICFMPSERLMPFIDRFPRTGMRLIAALSRELVTARRKVRDLALKGAESRLAALLNELAARDSPPVNGDRVQLGYTRREIAEMIGVSTETAIRLLGKLKDRGAITIEGRSIRITDVGRLRQVASYDDAEA